jgi:hypothetical protein
MKPKIGFYINNKLNAIKSKDNSSYRRIKKLLFLFIFSFSEFIMSARLRLASGVLAVHPSPCHLEHLRAQRNV